MEDEIVTITKEEYDALKEIVKKAYEYAAPFYEGYSLDSIPMFTARRHLMKSLDRDDEFVMKYRGW